MNEPYLQTIGALDVTIDEIICKGLTEELHKSTIATLGVISECFGKPTSQDIANANRQLKAYLIQMKLPENESLSRTEELTLVQVYAMMLRVRTVKQNHYQNS